MNGIVKPKLGQGIKLSIPAMPGLPKPEGTTVKNPTKVGAGLTVKTPKTKSLPDATDKPSVFFKNEEFSGAKHPSVRKLMDFMQKAKSKR
jgi:hypothetical protein